MQALQCSSFFVIALLLLPLIPHPLRAASPDIAATLQPFVDSHTLAGAVTLVANKDKTLSLQAVGYSDVSAKTPMRTDCLFWIASMSKPMTAAALMMLVDEGKVNLDDPVEKYLPEFRGQLLAVEQDADHVLLKKPAHPISVREILSHTSGLPFMSRIERKIDTYPLPAAAISYALTPLKFQPSTKYDYSNAGINTAGRIIEVVSGLPYEQFMSKRLFQPLGMTDTTFWPTDAQLHRLAKSYKPNAAKDNLEETLIDQLTYPLNNPHRAPCPAGGYFSTASDTALFSQLILAGGTFNGHRYLSAGAVRELTSTQTKDLLNQGKGEGGYGLGFSTSRKANPATVIPGPCGHGGAYATNLWIDPEKQLITIFMVQHASYPNTDGGKILPTFTQAATNAFAK